MGELMSDGVTTDEGHPPEDSEETLKEREYQMTQEKERARIAEGQRIAGREADPLRHTITERNPLIPQPEPAANPLVPLIDRPSRSRNAENTYDDRVVSETATGDPHVLTDVPYSEKDTRDELNRLAGEAGLDPGDYKTKAELVKALDKAEKAASHPVKAAEAPTETDTPVSGDFAGETEPVEISTSMSRAELELAARRHGVDPSKLRTKPRLVKAINDAIAAAQKPPTSEQG